MIIKNLPKLLLVLLMILALTFLFVELSEAKQTYSKGVPIYRNKVFQQEPEKNNEIQDGQSAFILQIEEAEISKFDDSFKDKEELELNIIAVVKKFMKNKIGIKQESINPWTNNSVQIYIKENYPMYANISNILFVYGPNGKVGIGTTSPQNTLNVKGTGNITSNFSVDNDILYVDAVGDSVGINTAAPLGNFMIRNIYPAQAYIWSDTSVSAHQDAYISFGYGGTRTAPTRSWYVGTGERAGSEESLMFGTDSGSWADLYADAAIVVIKPDGNVGIGTTTPSAKLEVKGDFLVDDVFFVNGNNGNVGIGTANPDYKLTIKGSGNEIYAVMSEDGTDKVDNLKIQIAPGFGTSTTRVGYLLGNFGEPNNGFLIGNLRNAPLRFGIGRGPTERMRINANGNVGIGITNPSEKLDVYGNIKISGATTETAGHVLCITSKKVIGACLNAPNVNGQCNCVALSDFP